MITTRTKPTGRRLTAASLLIVAIAACGSTDDAEETVEDVADIAEQSADDAEEASSVIADTLRENGLESIASAVQDVDFAAIADSEEFTFFAPNDDAFRSLGTDDMADLLSLDGNLEATLRNHVVNERIDAAALAERTSIETVGGLELPVSVDGDTVTVGDATVVETDVDVDNGVVHVVDDLFIDQ